MPRWPGSGRAPRPPAAKPQPRAPKKAEPVEHDEPVGDAFAENHLAANPYVRHVIESDGLQTTLPAIGVPSGPELK